MGDIIVKLKQLHSLCSCTTHVQHTLMSCPNPTRTCGNSSAMRNRRKPFNFMPSCSQPNKCITLQSNTHKMNCTEIIETITEEPRWSTDRRHRRLNVYILWCCRGSWLRSTNRSCKQLTKTSWSQCPASELRCVVLLLINLLSVSAQHSLGQNIAEMKTCEWVTTHTTFCPYRRTKMEHRQKAQCVHIMML